MSTKAEFNSNDIWELKNKEWEESVRYVKETLTPRALAYFVPILDIGREQCKSVIELNKPYYSSPYFGNVGTVLLTFSIMRLFDRKYLPKDFPYVVEPTTINKRNRYVVPMLKIGNIDLNILKAYNRNRVDDTNREYLKKRCKGNDVLRGQLDLLGDSNEKSRLHGVATYSIDKNWDKYNFIDLTFFGANLREVLIKVDLLKTLHIYEGDNSYDTNQRLVDDEDLKQDIQNELNELLRINYRYRYLMLQKQLSRRKWRVKEPLDDVLEDESPQLIQDIFDLLVNRNVLSKDYITNEICFDLEELTEICGLRDDFFKESLDITLLKKIDNISYIGNRK